MSCLSAVDTGGGTGEHRIVTLSEAVDIMLRKGRPHFGMRYWEHDEEAAIRAATTVDAAVAAYTAAFGPRRRTRRQIREKWRTLVVRGIAQAAPA